MRKAFGFNFYNFSKFFNFFIHKNYYLCTPNLKSERE